MVFGNAFIRFFLEMNNVELDKGIIIISEDEERLFEMEKRLRAMKDFVSFAKKGGTNPLNFQVEVVVCKNGKQAQEAVTVLQEENCLSVVFVAGVVPPVLYDEGYPMRVDIDEVCWQEFLKQFTWFVKKVKEHPEHVLKLIERAASSKMIKNMEGIQYSRFLRSSFCVGRIWEFFFYDKIGEEQSAEWFEEYFETCKQTAREIIDFDSGYDSSEVITRCMFEAVDKGDIKISDEFKENDDELVVYAEDKYFVPEYLLQKICGRLFRSVSFRQLKHEMKEVGMLETSGKNNYTKKKMIRDSSTNRVYRKRFLCIPEAYLYDETGLGLLDYYCLKMKQTEGNGGDLLC